MDAIELVGKFETYLSEIEKVVKPEYYQVIEDLREIDPHDLISPETWFQTEINARGFVWTLFLREIRKKELPTM
jgi:hypothetical protein